VSARDPDAGVRGIRNDGGMPTYLAFLRAINLGPKRVFPKDDIRRAVEGSGFTDVETYINTGNVRFSTPMRSRAKIEAALEAAFAADRGFEVPTIVFTAAEFAEIAREAEQLSAQNPGLARHYVYLMKEEPSAESVARLAELATVPTGRMVVRGRAAHALLGPGYQDGSVDPLNAVKLLGVATNRNLNVVTTLARKWC
jgi:uncharacterized protein (DUF1697 family)